VETKEQLPPAEFQQVEAWPPGLNRDAMTADAIAVLSWLLSSATWTLLAQTVTPLLGRSPLLIASGLFSAVIELPELEDLLVLALDRIPDYLGEPREDGLPFRLNDGDRRTLAALRGALAGAFG
jgi:hypothetical protein